MYILFSFLWKSLAAATPFVGVTAFSGALFCEIEYRVAQCEGKKKCKIKSFPGAII